jgi:hypothetical protein
MEIRRMLRRNARQLRGEHRQSETARGTCAQCQAKWPCEAERHARHNEVMANELQRETAKQEVAT